VIGRTSLLGKAGLSSLFSGARLSIGWPSVQVREDRAAGALELGCCARTETAAIRKISRRIAIRVILSPAFATIVSEDDLTSCCTGAVSRGRTVGVTLSGENELSPLSASNVQLGFEPESK